MTWVKAAMRLDNLRVSETTLLSSNAQSGESLHHLDPAK